MSENFITIYKFPEFVKKVKKILDSRELDGLLEYLAKHPEHGVIIPGTGGIRKIRWVLRNKGKRGGARVIYYYNIACYEILLLTIYVKNKQDDLTHEDKMLLKELIQEYLKQGG